MKKILISIVLVIFMALSTFQYAKWVIPYLKVEYTLGYELLFMTIQLLIQLTLLYFHNKLLITEYLYAKSIALGIGAIALWLFMGIFYLYPVSAREAVVIFIFVMAIIYAVHQERVYALKLPYYFCYTWVIYRVLVFALLADF